MRLAIIICGFALVASPAFSQTKDVFMPAPTEPMMLQTATRTEATPLKAAGAKNQVSDPQLDRQVSTTQQLIQQEERKLQAQFAQLDQMRNAAIDKQNQTELERIQRLEQQVVAAYQKRVEQLLVAAQAQIQATTVHVQSNQTQQPTLAPQPTKSTRAAQTGQARTPAAGTAKPQSTQQQTRKPSQSSQQQKSSGFWLFGRR